MTWVAVGVAVVGGVMGAVGEKKKRKGIRSLNAKNALRLEQQARHIEQQTEEDIVLLRQRLTRVIGEQRAGWGASGLSGGEGSPMDVLADSVTQGINDQRRRRLEGEIAAGDLRYQAEIGNLQASAMVGASNAAGNAALIQGIGQAASYAGNQPKPTTINITVPPAK
jgi:hypothetical protein